MKAMLKSRLHTAVAAGLIGLASTGAVDAANWSRGNTGQALVFPYYTVNNDWITTLNVMNTSNQTLPVKLRVHESKNSRDVLDFNIVLSPYDAWTGWLVDSDDGPVLKTTDRSCTSPVSVRDNGPTSGTTASTVAYTGSFDDTGGNGRNRMREGYVEVIVMGVQDTILAPPLDWQSDVAFANGETLYVPYHAEHVDGEPRNCTLVDDAFLATTSNWLEETDPTAYTSVIPIADSLGGSGDPRARLDFDPTAAGNNPLKGNVTWLHTNTGTGAGSEAIAVENWAAPAQNYVTAQQPPWFLEPTFASEDGLWTVTGVIDFDTAVSALSTFNEWANNEANGAATDWAVTFPTKAYHVDKFNDQIQAAVSKYRNGLTDVVETDPLAPLGSDCDLDRTVCVETGTPVLVAPFEFLFGETGNGDSPITVQYDVYDREEGSQVVETDGTTTSPALPPDVVIETLRFEANVIQFGNEPVLDSNNPAIVDASGFLEGAPNGWARITFTGLDAVGVGLPVTAFAVKERTRAEVSATYGQAMDHGYELLPVAVPVP